MPAFSPEYGEAKVGIIIENHPPQLSLSRLR